MGTNVGIRRWLIVMLALAMLAGACGGEVSEDADGDDTQTDDGTDGSDSSDGGDDDATDDTSDSGDGDNGDDDSGDGDTDDTAGGDDDGAGAPNVFVDPRGGIFADFQAGFDRGDHPFTQIETFCRQHDAAADRVDVEPGIGADEITIVHIRSRLEDAVNVGFGIPVGDVNEMFRVFVEFINDECGGVRGRQVVLETIEVSLFGPTTQEERNAACLEATEDFNAAMIVNSSGFQGSATLCIVEEKETIFISTQGQPDEFMERSGGRLFSLGTTNSESLRFAAQDWLDRGVITADSVVGVATPDTPGQPETVAESLVGTLEAAGVTVIFDELGCGGGTICTDGVAESVANMRAGGITHFVNVMGILTAPGYVDEMVNAGFQPGDVQFLATDFNNATSELVSGQITNNADSGALYNGAEMVAFRTTGDYRSDGYAPPAFNQMCVDLYNANNTVGADVAWQDQGGSSEWGMTASICTILRLAMRAIYDAGDNPTRADLEAAMQNLGPVDIGGMVPGSITPGKGAIPDVIQTMNFSFPCDQVFPFTTNNGNDICVTGENEYRPVAR